MGVVFASLRGYAFFVDFAADACAAAQVSRKYVTQNFHDRYPLNFVCDAHIYSQNLPMNALECS